MRRRLNGGKTRKMSMGGNVEFEMRAHLCPLNGMNAVVVVVVTGVLEAQIEFRRNSKMARLNGTLST